jgi:hypothetical protein
MHSAALYDTYQSAADVAAGYNLNTIPGDFEDLLYLRHAADGRFR